MSIEARPESASITLDGVPVSNPYTAERAWDGGNHRVRVMAPGFVAQESDVRFDADVRMFRALSPAPAGATSAGTVAGPPSHPRVGTHAANSAAPAPTPAAGSCDPPYFLDARGIKKFKPECL